MTTRTKRVIKQALLDATSNENESDYSAVFNIAQATVKIKGHVTHLYDVTGKESSRHLEMTDFEIENMMLEANKKEIKRCVHDIFYEIATGDFE